MIATLRPVSTVYPRSAAAWATNCGSYGAKVTDPKRVEKVIRQALAFDGPAIVDFDVDPNEPPLPNGLALRSDVVSLLSCGA